VDLAFTTEPHDHYLKMTVTGHWKLPDIMELIEIIKAAAEQAGNDRVLVDLRGVEGRPKEMDRFYADERAAKVFGFKLKVAVVARRGYQQVCREHSRQPGSQTHCGVI